MPAYEFEGLVPVVDPTAFVHPTAVLIGDVHVGPGAFVGPLSTLRGDFGRIEVREGANFQDGCVFHSFPGASAILDRDGHVGHGAILHGCAIEDDCLIGMGATILNGAVVGQGSLVAAGSVVLENTLIPSGSLVTGVPAKALRSLNAEERASLVENARHYAELSQRHAQSAG
jgi:carbonic anhydrase/acetyltransferase-like protein (isoleucine patch superfamily)